MRIAIVHPYPWPEVRRGAERYLDDLGHYLAGAGHVVEVVTGTKGKPRLTRREDGVLFRYVRHLEPGPAARVGLSEVETFGARALRPLFAWCPDVVHAFTPSGAIAGRLAGRPTVYTVLGHPDRAQLPPSRVLQGLFKSAVKSAHVTAVLSKASLGALRDTFNRHSVVLPPGVRLERFPPALEARTGPPRILFSASLADRRKRVDLAVQTLSVLLQRHPDARLALSGEGDASWALETASREGDHVRAALDILGPGAPADVPARYREASVTLLPAEHEAFGLALVESLASGTPAVCAPTGGMPEIVGHDEGVGVVAHSTDPRSLAEALEGALILAAQPGTASRCAQRARLWSWDEAVGPAHERLYSEMTTGTESPNPGFEPDSEWSARFPSRSRETDGADLGAGATDLEGSSHFR